MVYQIRLQGHLSEQWAASFEGMIFTLEENGDTMLTGPVTELTGEVTAVGKDVTRSYRFDNYSILLDNMSIMQELAETHVTQDINSRIARRVRAIRMGLGLTLDALADNAMSVAP